MAEKEKLDVVHQNSIHIETIRKEHRYQKLHTEFGINPHRKLHVVTDKPMSRKPKEVIEENSDFIKAFHKAHLVPNMKYAMPQTESQEIGWVSTPLIPSDRHDSRFHFHRMATDVTKYKEADLNASN
ncbi:cilia- and flagella-associated protein 144 [Clinocottus analis]|uniref:cilia- and flagella-associated protein 144 n=1 Tax=Clinocottus analis TaxID=304258 RepID=UPI0035BFE609